MANLNEKFGITYPVPIFILQDPQYKAISRKPKVILLYGYLILRTNADPNTSTNITTKQIVRETSISINTIQSGLKSLEDHGLIIKRDLGRKRTIYVTTFEGSIDTKLRIA